MDDGSDNNSQTGASASGAASQGLPKSIDDQKRGGGVPLFVICALSLLMAAAVALEDVEDILGAMLQASARTESAVAGWPAIRRASLLVLADALILAFGWLVRHGRAAETEQRPAGAGHLDALLAWRSDWAIHPLALTLAALFPVTVWGIQEWSAVLTPSTATTVLIGIGVVTLVLCLATLYTAWQRDFPPAIEVTRAFGGGMQRLHIQPHVWLGLLTIVCLAVWLAMARDLSAPPEAGAEDPPPAAGSDPAAASTTSTGGGNV